MMPGNLMAMELTKQEKEAAIRSLQQYFNDELEQELSELRAGLLLDFFLQELAPLAYNRGVQDAERFFRARLEDLPATCFEAPFRYGKGRKRR